MESESEDTVQSGSKRRKRKSSKGRGRSKKHDRSRRKHKTKGRSKSRRRHRHGSRSKSKRGSQAVGRQRQSRSRSKRSHKRKNSKKRRKSSNKSKRKQRRGAYLELLHYAKHFGEDGLLRNKRRRLKRLAKRKIIRDKQMQRKFAFDAIKNAFILKRPYLWFKMEHYGPETYGITKFKWKSIRPGIFQLQFYLLNMLQGIAAFICLTYFLAFNPFTHKVPPIFCLHGLYVIIYIASFMDIFGSIFGIVTAYNLEGYGFFGGKRKRRRRKRKRKRTIFLCCRNLKEKVCTKIKEKVCRKKEFTRLGVTTTNKVEQKTAIEPINKGSKSSRESLSQKSLVGESTAPSITITRKSITPSLPGRRSVSVAASARQGRKSFAASFQNATYPSNAVGRKSLFSEVNEEIQKPNNTEYKNDHGDGSELAEQKRNSNVKEKDAELKSQINKDSQREGEDEKKDTNSKTEGTACCCFPSRKPEYNKRKKSKGRNSKSRKTSRKRKRHKKSRKGSRSRKESKESENTYLNPEPHASQDLLEIGAEQRFGSLASSNNNTIVEEFNKPEETSKRDEKRKKISTKSRKNRGRHKREMRRRKDKKQIQSQGDSGNKCLRCKCSRCVCKLLKYISPRWWYFKLLSICLSRGRSREFIDAMGTATWLLFQLAWFMDIFFVAYYHWAGMLYPDSRVAIETCQWASRPVYCHDFNQAYFYLALIVGVSFVLRNILVFLIGLCFPESRLRRRQHKDPHSEQTTTCSDSEIDYMQVPRPVLLAHIPDKAPPGARKNPYEGGSKRKRVMSAKERHNQKLLQTFQDVRRAKPVAGKKRGDVRIRRVKGAPDTLQMPTELMTTKARAWLTDETDSSLEPEIQIKGKGPHRHYPRRKPDNRRRIRSHHYHYDEHHGIERSSESLTLIHDPESKSQLPIEEVIKPKLAEISARVSTDDSWSGNTESLLESGSDKSPELKVDAARRKSDDDYMLLMEIADSEGDEELSGPNFSNFYTKKDNDNPNS